MRGTLDPNQSGKELRGFKIYAFEPENYVESNGAVV